MSYIAFIDYKRTKSILAKDVNEREKSKRYYCINPNCDAYLSICNLNGEYYRPYFSAKDKEHPHVIGCPYCSSKGSNIGEYVEKDFKFEEIVEKLMVSRRATGKSHRSETGSKKEEKRTICNLGELYEMCKSLGIHQTYNQYVIGLICLDNRSQKWYYKGVFGYKIIECYLKKEKISISDNGCIIKINRYVNDIEYRFVMKYREKSLFLKMKERIYKLINYNIVIAGKWSKLEYNVFETQVNNIKQILFVDYNGNIEK